jgi:hypothetical protein
LPRRRSKYSSFSWDPLNIPELWSRVCVSLWLELVSIADEGGNIFGGLASILGACAGKAAIWGGLPLIPGLTSAGAASGATLGALTSICKFQYRTG